MSDEMKMKSTKVARVGEISLLPVDTFLVQYTDRKTGKAETKLGFHLGGNQVRFLDERSLTGEVQEWLKSDIIKALTLIANEDEKKSHE